MKINKDFVPSTIKAAAEHIAQSIADDERQVIRDGTLDSYMVHHTVGRYLRNGWSLWKSDTPLKRDAVKQYKIAHADDISGLILDWAVAIIRGEDFDPVESCQRYHDHWRESGMTALEAGGWKE